MDIPNIVKHLLQDLILVENWTKFYFELGLPGSDYVQLEQGFRNGTISSFELFVKILTKWESRQGRAGTTEKLCDLLDKLDFNLVTTRIRNEKSEKPSLSSTASHGINITWPLRFGFIETTGNFFGRSTEMEQLLEDFKTYFEFQMFLISGLGGIGKTELAKNFATVVFREESATCTLFSGDTAASFRNTLMSLAGKLCLSLVETPAKGTIEIFEDVARLISKNLNSSKWLVIVDNLEEEIDEVSSMLEILSEMHKVFVLVTSRNRSVLGPEALHLPLEGLNLADAMTFIRSTLGCGDEEENAIVELCQTLQNYPLALRQAVGFIKEQQRDSLLGAKFGVNDYLQKYKKESQKLLGYRLSKFSDKYGKTTLLTWGVTMNKIKTYEFGTTALDLLDILAYVNPSGISVQFLQILCGKVFQNSSSGIEQALMLLKKYSLVKIEDLVIQIHPLVQQVTQISLKSQEMEVNFLKKLILGVIESKSQLKLDDFPSVVKILDYVQNHEQLHPEFPFAPGVISSAMLKCGMYKESLNFSRENYSWLQEKYGDTNQHVLKVKKYIARGLQLTGNFQEALQIILEVHEDMRIHLGTDDPLTLNAADLTARILSDLGRYDDALRIYDHLIETRQMVLGEDHPDTRMTVQVKAAVLFKLKRYDEAMDIYKEIFDWQKQHTIDKSNRTLLTTMHKIGVCHHCQENYEQAQKILENVVTLRSKNLGKLHPETLLAKYDLAMTLCCLTEKDQGLTMLREVWKTQCQVLGKEDFRTKLTAEQIERISLLIENPV